MATTTKKTFAKLGYSQLDTAEIVILLNRLLSNYSVFQQKLRNFYWNVVGQDFFEMSKQLEQMFDRAVNDTDQIAKRIRLFGQNPHSTLAEYLKHATIIEIDKGVSSFEMVKMLLQDIRVLLELMGKTVEAAEEISDNGTKSLLQSIIYEMENDHRMFTAWMKQGI